MTFDQFYSAYPRKKSPGQAKRTWAKLNPDQETFDSIMVGLEKAKKYWTNIDKRFIPYPSTWLNNEGWLDEYDVDLNQQSVYANQSTSYKPDNTPVSENRAERLRAIRQRVGI